MHTEQVTVLQGTGLGAAVGRIIDRDEACATACRAALALLPSGGEEGDGRLGRLLRQCADLCEVHALSLRRRSALAPLAGRRCIEACLETADALAMARVEELRGATKAALVALLACREVAGVSAAQA